MPDIKLPPELFVLPLRVYYEDTDAGGVVYHSNYLNFFERCRTEWLRHLGYEQDELRDKYSILFVVRNINITYLKPALFNQQLMITSEVTEWSACSITMQQQVLSEDVAGDIEIYAKGSVSLACVDSETFRPKRTPSMIRQSLLSTKAQA